MRGEKSGQVWVETIIYTLIALTMIGLVLSFVKPKIEEMQDKAIIDQSVDLVKDIDGIIKEVVIGGTGNKRRVDLGIKKGILKINAEEDTIIFEIQSAYTYSEPGVEVKSGDLSIFTEEKGKLDLITLIMNYSETYDLTLGTNTEKILNKASLPYTVFIENRGISGTIPLVGVEVN